MADRLLQLLQKADRERTATLAVEGQTLPVLEKGNPNVRLGRALVDIVPTQHAHTTPDVPKAQPTVIEPGSGGNTTTYKDTRVALRQALGAIEKAEGAPRPQIGPSGDRLKQLLDNAATSAAQKAPQTTPTLGRTNSGPSI